MSGAAIVWLRRELRLSDNPALCAALEEGAAVIPVFVLEEPDAEAPGSASRWWLHRSLAALDRDLRALGSRLVLRRGDALSELRALITECSATSLHWNRRYTPAAIARDAAIVEALEADGVRVLRHKASLLADPWEVRTKQDGPFRVYTPFWRAFRSQIELAEPQPAPSSLPAPVAWPDGLELDALGLEPHIDWAGGLAETWSPGEAGAWKRIERFLDGVVDGYGEARDLPAVEGVSRISPHLAFGEISPCSVWHTTVLATEGVALQGEGGGHRFLQELVWREFAYHVLYHFPETVDRPMQPKFAAFPWRSPGDYAEDLLRWKRGETGIPMVDAGMRQLWATGWMHNRVRMIVGSLLVKNLLIPWWEGAAHFHDTLVDLDLPNNTLGWQWVGGCGADAAPYFRIFNPVSQGERFDPEGAYVRRWVPELADLPDREVHQPWVVGGVEGYPEPIVDLKASRQRALDALQATKGSGD